MLRCQFLFSAVFGFRNPTQEIFSELDKTKAKPSILPRRTQRAREVPEGGQGGPTPYLGAGPSLAAPPGGEATPLAPPTPLFRLYILSVVKTLKESTIFHKEFHSRRHREDKFRGTESLFRHAAGTGNCPRSHLHRHHCHLHRCCCLP